MKKLRHCHPICIIYHYKTLPSPCDHVRTLAHRAEGLSSAATRRIGAAALRFERVSRQFRKSSPLTALPCRRRVRAVHTCSCCLSAEDCDARQRPAVPQERRTRRSAEAVRGRDAGETSGHCQPPPRRVT